MEVIDLRTVAPLDMEPVLASVRKTVGYSSPTKRSSPSASEPRSPPPWHGTASGTWTHRSSGWELRPPLRRTLPSSSGPGSPDRQEITDAVRRMAAL